MPEFANIEAAQKWLDANGEMLPFVRLDEYERKYGRSPARCARECRMLAYLGTATEFKMAARRLSNALAYHYPQMFEPRPEKRAA